MVIVEIVFALVATSFLLMNRGVDVALDRVVASRRLPSPPTGVVLDGHTVFVLGAHDWGKVIFWSFVHEDEARRTFERVRLRRMLFRVDADEDEDGSGRYDCSEVTAAGFNRHVDGAIRSALRRHMAARRSRVTTAAAARAAADRACDDQPLVDDVALAEQTVAAIETVAYGDRAKPSP